LSSETEAEADSVGSESEIEADGSTDALALAEASPSDALIDGEAADSLAAADPAGTDPEAVAEGSELTASDPSGLGVLSLKSPLGEGSALAESVGEADPDSADTVIDADAVGSLSHSPPAEAEADGSDDAPPLDEGDSGLAEPVGADSDHDSDAEAEADPSLTE
jgi:hypothetical protein